MPQDSDIRAAVKGFSSQLRARILQAWMTKPTTDDEYAYCRTRGRSTPCSRCLSMESVCVAYNISCSNCSVGEVACSRFLDEKYHRIQRFITMDIASIPALVQACLDLQHQTLTPVAMKERFESSEYTNNLYGYGYSRAETSIPGFHESFLSHLLPGEDALTEIGSDINRTVYLLHQENEDLRRENDQLRERFRLEVEPKESESKNTNGMVSVSLTSCSRHSYAEPCKQWVNTTSCLPPRLARKKFS
ncbi:hypothetical protein ARMSODRAFT_510770 [Armillaria solidipes]|uniref:Zn(2)-C6 fungal-type domain-containing protein n=1 Tax=Armillaria solidipes TaxID=1076256 RepID=A0A2H3CGD0_9AGAR|nr:hypothetical protein ARMSODRAFT_510770 [Armillaria solidipes]